MKKQYFILIGIFTVIGLYFLVGFITGDYFKIDGTIAKTDSTWVGPSIYLENKTLGEERELVIYGQELIAHTSKYLGPKVSVAQITNGMNCQNCHLQAGNQPYGINFGSVWSTYPKFRPHRPRGESSEDLFMRVSSCFERSLNGTSPAKGSKEMQSILAYINYVGGNVPKGQKAKGSGIYEMPLLSRAADPVRGKMIYAKKCVSCHLENGEGQLAADGKSYQYPPLWGSHSYNSAAGLFLLSKFAGYVKANMPQGATYRGPLLSDEDCWDLAAYVNSQPRPSKDLGKESPLLEEKLFDYPFGPYADGFSENISVPLVIEPLSKSFLYKDDEK